MNEALIRFLRDLFQPLVRAIDEPPYATILLRNLGYELPQNVIVFPELQAAVSSLSDTITAVEELAPDATYEEYLTLVPAVVTAIRTIIDTINTLQTRAAAATTVAFDFAVLDELPGRLLEYLLATALVRYHGKLNAAIRTVGIVEEQLQPAGPTAFHRAYIRQRIRWDRIGRLISDPVGLLQEVYGWGTGNFAFVQAASQLANLGVEFGVPAELITPKPAFNPGFNANASTVDRDVIAGLRGLRIPLLPEIGAGIGLEIYPALNGAGDAIAGFGIGIYADPTLTTEVQISDELRMRFDFAGGAAALPSIVVLPGAGIQFVNDIFGQGASGQNGNFEARLNFNHEPVGRRILFIGDEEGTRLDAGSTEFTLGLGGGAQRDPDIFFSLGLKGGALVIDASQADGFLTSLLPTSKITVPFDVALGFSTRRGIYFEGSGGLELSLALHFDLGPVTIETLLLNFNAAAESLDLEVSVTGSARIGPIGISVDRIGAAAVLRFVSGNLGPVDLGFNFKPPTGLGLVIDAGPITGGGYIAFDRDAGRYSGALELDLFGIGVTAIGVLDTKDAGGQSLPAPGFSFLLMISAQFEALQLGFGFTLNRVGGLVGIHRAMALERLRSGVRDGSLDHVMFPADPIRNMPQIISDISAVYPATANRFVLGPMAEIGWGAPTLFKARIGLIIELPSPVVLALLGQIDVALPTEDAAIVSLHIAILGVLDSGRKELSIDASLYDSRVALFSVYGDMAMRLSWGDQPSFALSIGGLNPHFQPPAGFPTLRRVTVSLGLGENPRISLQAYLAVTSNSIQFGANAELYAAAGPLNVYGWLRFDALVIFSPFYFIFEFSVGFALRWNEDVFAGIALSGLLSGPSPFHIRGEACISILFVDICIGFDVTVGEEKPFELPEKNPWSVLAAAIQDARNWSAEPDGGRAALVRIKDAGTPGLMLVPPMGSVNFRQKIVPLNFQLEKFGEFKISGVSRFALNSVIVGSGQSAHTTPFAPIRDFFAPGQFEELPDGEKLSRKSFELLDAGISAGDDRVACGNFASVRLAPIQYQTWLVDEPNRRGQNVSSAEFTRTTQVAMSTRSAKAYSPVRRSGLARFSSARKWETNLLADEDYVIVNTDNRAARVEFGTGLNKTITLQILDAHLAAHPGDRGHLQVIRRADLEEQP